MHLIFSNTVTQRNWIYFCRNWNYRNIFNTNIFEQEKRSFVTEQQIFARIDSKIDLMIVCQEIAIRHRKYHIGFWKLEGMFRTHGRIFFAAYIALIKLYIIITNVPLDESSFIDWQVVLLCDKFYISWQPSLCLYVDYIS